MSHDSILENIFSVFRPCQYVTGVVISAVTLNSFLDAILASVLNPKVTFLFQWLHHSRVPRSVIFIALGLNAAVFIENFRPAIDVTE